MRDEEDPYSPVIGLQPGRIMSSTMPTLLMWGKPADAGRATISFSRFDGSEPVTADLPDEFKALSRLLKQVETAIAILDSAQQSPAVGWPHVAIWARGDRGRHRVTATFKPGKPSKKKRVALPSDRDQLFYFKRRIEDSLDVVRRIPKDRGYVSGGGEDREHWRFERPTMGS
jgi:hypothetical protein